jgi:hypothetical protein
VKNVNEFTYQPAQGVSFGTIYGTANASNTGQYHNNSNNIIFIQLQLGWNPVAEVYNTYTASV